MNHQTFNKKSYGFLLYFTFQGLLTLLLSAFIPYYIQSYWNFCRKSTIRMRQKLTQEEEKYANCTVEISKQKRKKQKKTIYNEGKVNLSLCPVLPKTLGIFNHNSRVIVLVVTGKSTRSYGHNYPLYWATLFFVPNDFS